MTTAPNLTCSNWTMNVVACTTAPVQNVLQSWKQKVKLGISSLTCIPHNDCHTPLSLHSTRYISNLYHSTRYISNLYYSTRFEKSKLIVVPVQWLLILMQRMCLVMAWKFLTLLMVIIPVLVLIVSPGLPLLNA